METPIFIGRLPDRADRAVSNRFAAVLLPKKGKKLFMNTAAASERFSVH
jgi:hypothetical protein